MLPAIEKLAALMAAVPPSIPVVIVMPPAFFTSIPRPGTLSAARLASCKAALSAVVAGRAGGNFLDFLVDGPIARDPESFNTRPARPRLPRA